jgi:hypothetical protein
MNSKRMRSPRAQTDARDLVNALVKLYEDNASTLTPDPLYSAFYAFASACIAAHRSLVAVRTHEARLTRSKRAATGASKASLSPRTDATIWSPPTTAARCNAVLPARQTQRDRGRRPGELRSSHRRIRA